MTFCVVVVLKALAAVSVSNEGIYLGKAHTVAIPKSHDRVCHVGRQFREISFDPVRRWRHFR